MIRDCGTDPQATWPRSAPGRISNVHTPPFLDSLSFAELGAILLPLLAIQLSLMIWALVDLVRRERVRGGSKLVWVLVILLLNFIGPILYLVWGRNE
ncbi:MAG: hypothetical protein GX536_04705 [Actinobacteria bacterium]|nr:hypothetical protein [Actinomycetota bacterium]